MQSQLPHLAATPLDQHIPYLNNMHQRQRLEADRIRQQTLQAQREKQKAQLERKNKDGSPRKATIRSHMMEVIPQRTDEEQKLRKVVQHEINHYTLADSTSPRKRPRPTIPMTPPASPASIVGGSNMKSSPGAAAGGSPGLKSILKVSTVPEDISHDSPLKGIMVEKTASAKLNYLLERIVKLHKDEKIIVFSEYSPVMWYLGESLELLGIPHLIYIQKLVWSLYPPPLHPSALTPNPPPLSIPTPFISHLQFHSLVYYLGILSYSRSISSIYLTTPIYSPPPAARNTS
jgi:hypothetical protein